MRPKSPRGRVEGKVKNMGQIFKAEAVAPKLERDEPTPQGADDAQQETAAAAHIADASQRLKPSIICLASRT